MTGNFRLPLILVFLLLPLQIIRASSRQAYTDYLFRFDRYRQSFSAYQVAANQYRQFGSLSAQQETLDKVKLLLAERDAVGKLYLLFLNEKLTENPGMLDSERDLYRQVITNQIGFLDNHSVTIPAIGSLADAGKSSKDFVTQYANVQLGIKKTIAAIHLGYLDYFARRYDEAAGLAQQLIDANRGSFRPETVVSFERWLSQIANKRVLYQDKAHAVRTLVLALKGDIPEQDRSMAAVRTGLVDARAYLAEGTTFLAELRQVIQYER